MFDRIRNYLNAADLEVREGSVESAGGDSPLPGIYPPLRTTGGLTPETAIQIGAVYRAVQIVQTLLSSMALYVTRDGRRIPISSQNKNLIVAKPNINDTQSAVVEETVYSLALYGNAYWRLYRSDAASTVQNIEVLDPSLVYVWEDENTGRRKYNYGDKTFQDWQIKHLKLMRIPGSLTGVGPVQAAPNELYAALTLQRYREAWFDAGGVVKGILTSDQQLNAEDAAEYAEAFNEFVARNEGIAVLGNGLAYQPLVINPKDAQFQDIYQSNVIAIARLFGVPSTHLMAGIEGSSMTYTNMEEANISFQTFTLNRYMNEIEGALTDLIPRGQTVQFDESTILRSDTKTKWDVRAIQTSIGYATGNSLREEDGLDPIASPETE